MPRGGKRPGAGRKKTGKRVGGPHRVRPFLDPRHPVHVVLRSKRRLSWRTGRTYAVLRRVLAFALGNPDFRICHISIQQRHLHLIVEASSREALTLGIQTFSIRAARAINRDRHTRGKVFAFRYHDSQITTAKYARHALAYVLKNASHCTLSGRRVEFPTCWAQTRLLQRAQSAVGYRRPRFEDFIWDRPPLPWPGQIDFEVRNSARVPQQLQS